MHIGLVAVVAFNLICTGTQTSGEKGTGISMRNVKTAPFTRTYRVNLTEKRWCLDECKTTESLSKITETMIEFENSEIGSVLREAVSYVNREDGYFAERVRFGSIVTVSTGKCVRSDFSGFPERLF